MWKPDKIIGSGETGATIGGLVGAKHVLIETGGFAARGYMTEAGPQRQILKERYNLIECPSDRYPFKAAQNVEASDATLISAIIQDNKETQLTANICEEKKKPFLIINPENQDCIEQALRFIQEKKPRVLNVAGNSESLAPGIASKTARFVAILFDERFREYSI